MSIAVNPPEPNNIIEIAQIIHIRISEFIEKLKDTYGYTEEELDKLINNVNFNITTAKSKLKKNENNIEYNLCECVIKSGARSGQQCGSKVKEGKYCNRHLKYADSLDETPDEKLDYEYTAKLNKHGRYEFGKTGLIFKSQKEVYIIGKQLDSGTIIKLSEEDKELCKKHKLRYIKS